ncbi:hypothetical protein TRFO_33981 [Tritrichomonas foetus]|uniref:Protein kinase domain-containing protein n=1 Tax=Tritrichomonas foetus TaxID=1144522 RepID=A0A1J4JQP5_9EUKA|nr:hypothetical protein TRFO_33981 [Tritrichomonas foetus]|eukprot:OHS99564.1 hypothetical protein TRFO_33981 [Tritrichomonas foetus]
MKRDFVDSGRASPDRSGPKERVPMDFDPSGRYQRFDEPLSLSEVSVRYKAYDKESGLEVAWHEIILDSRYFGECTGKCFNPKNRSQNGYFYNFFTANEKKNENNSRSHLIDNKVDCFHTLLKKLLINNAEIMKKMRHQNINSFLHFWTEEDRYEASSRTLNNLNHSTNHNANSNSKNQMNSNHSIHSNSNNHIIKLFYITESVSTNSILRNISDITEIRSKVLSRWFLPVLESLNFLHSQNPAIIHGRIQLSSIFIKPTTGAVKITSPLLLSPLQFVTNIHLKLRPSTPPEFLNNDCGTYSDIWHFGLALLHVITKIEPYIECETPFHLIRKLMNYEPPDSLKLVKDRLAWSLISSCLMPPNERPTASELLRHPFFLQNFNQKSEEANLTHASSEGLATNEIQDDGFVVIFSGKPTKSNETLPLSASKKQRNTNVPLQKSGRFAVSVPHFGIGNK